MIATPVVVTAASVGTGPVAVVAVVAAAVVLAAEAVPEAPAGDRAVATRLLPPRGGRAATFRPLVPAGW